MFRRHRSRCGMCRTFSFCSDEEVRSCATPQELAWASYALMRNTAAAALLVMRGGEVLAARGALGDAAATGSSAETLSALNEVRAAPQAVGHSQARRCGWCTFRRHKGDLHVNHAAWPEHLVLMR